MTSLLWVAAYLAVGAALTTYMVRTDFDGDEVECGVCVVAWPLAWGYMVCYSWLKAIGAAVRWLARRRS